MTVDLQPSVGALPRLAFRRSEAAASLGISIDAFDDHVAPHVRWIRLGRLRLVAVAELEQWCDRSAARTIDGDRRGG